MTKSQRFIPGSPERPQFYELMRFIVRILSGLLFRLDIEGLENIPSSGPAILAGNHLSFWDIPSSAVAVPRHLHFIAAERFAKFRLVRWLFFKVEIFFIQSGKGGMRGIRDALAVLEAGQVLFIYPEGHRAKNHAMARGLAGVVLIAFKSGVPVIPVAIWGSELVMKKRGFGPWRPVVHVRYGKPIAFSFKSKGDRKELLQVGINEIMKAIAVMLPPRYRGFYSNDISESSNNNFAKEQQGKDA